jgi:tryptophan 2,3-dioxygenase
MEEYNTINIWQSSSNSDADQKNEDLVKAMRHFDHTVILPGL